MAVTTALPDAMRPTVSEDFITVNDALLEAVERRMLDLVTSPPENLNNVAPQPGRAAEYHLGVGGRRLRARLALHAAMALGLGPDDAVVLAATVELLHNASLVHDDLQDRGLSRRGAEAVWVRFGGNVAICTGDVMLSAAYAALAGFSNSSLLPTLLALVHARVRFVIDGQCADLSAMDAKVADMAVYERIAAAKTGPLLCLPIELACVAAGQRRWAATARKAAESFAVAYQIVDDLDDDGDDAATEAQPNLLNVVRVLRAAGHQGDVRAHALALGLGHLDAAIATAQSLPNGSGALMAELARRLRPQA